MEFELVYWDHPGFGNCTQRSKERLVGNDNPPPVKPGTVLRDGGAIAISLARRVTLGNTDIASGSVAVEILYSTLCVEKAFVKNIQGDYSESLRKQTLALQGERARQAEEKKPGRK